MKFCCSKCGKEYTDADRKMELFCECGARRLKASFGKLPKIPSEIRSYIEKIFEEAEKSFGRSRDELVYEKAFILLAFLKFICNQPEAVRGQDFLTLYKNCRQEIIKIFRKTADEFRREDFRVPTSAMPGMAEDEMLGFRSSKLKMSLAEYKDVRVKLMNQTDYECKNSIEFLEIQLKNKLY